MRKLLLFSTALYSLSILVGYAFVFEQEPWSWALNKDVSIFESDGSFQSILKNNVFVISALLSGALTFGASTFLRLSWNGIILGVAVAEAYNQGKLLALFLYTLPHGVLEIPAIIIAGADTSELQNTRRTVFIAVVGYKP